MVFNQKDVTTAVSGKKATLLCLTVFLAVLFMGVTMVYQGGYDFRYKVLIVDSSQEDQTRVQYEPASSVSPFNPLQPSDKHQVLLITYGRSGSSFTSALISHHEDVFFVFEPLHILKKYTTDLKLKSEPDEDRGNSSMDIVSSYLSCHFTQYYVFSLLNMHSSRDKHTKAVNDCLTAKIAGTKHVTCFLKFLETCQNHSTTFVKTIRFKVQWAEWFLEHNPNFKLLYLIRDPRATLFSQAVTFQSFSWVKDINNVSKTHCSNVAEDLATAERLKGLYPDRVKGIRYEHGAEYPVAYTEEIYEFLGLEYNDAVTQYINDLTNHTEADIHTKEAYAVVRTNSTETMNKWRYTAGFQQVKVIDDNCGHLYSKLGYKPVESQEELESERSLVQAPYPGGVF